MQRRGYLALVGAALLGGCSSSGGETPAPDGESSPAGTATAAPTATPTAAHWNDRPDVVDPSAAARHLDAARSNLRRATDEFDADVVPVPDLSTAFAVDAGAVERAVSAARADVASAREVASRNQQAAADAAWAFGDAVEATVTLHTAVAATGDGIIAGRAHADEGEYAAARTSYEEAAVGNADASAALDDARKALDRAAELSPDADLPVAALRAELDAGATVVGPLGALAEGGRETSAGRLRLDAGVASFRDGAYERAVDEFGDAFGRFEAAKAALAGAGAGYAADRLERAECLAEQYRDGARTLQSGALEVSSGDSSVGFDEYREGLSQVRDAEQYC